MMFAFTNAVLPLYLAGYGLPNAVIGVLSQERPPLAGLSQIVAGALSDRTRTPLGRRRPYILAGIPVAAAALLALALRPPLWAMLFALVLTTTALAIAYGPYLALLADLVPARQRARAGAVLALGSGFGQLLFLSLAAQFWPQQAALVFVLVAGGLLAGFALVLLGVREKVLAPAALEPLSFRPVAYVRGVLEHREVMKHLFATLFFWLGTGGVVPFLTRFQRA
jgi:Na+/melibiose symporter-like transporter